MKLFNRVKKISEASLDSGIQSKIPSDDETSQATTEECPCSARESTATKIFPKPAETYHFLFKYDSPWSYSKRIQKSIDKSYHQLGGTTNGFKGFLIILTNLKHEILALESRSEYDGGVISTDGQHRVEINGPYTG